MSDFKLTPAREKELEKIAKDLPDKSFKDKYGKDWKSVKIATAMNILKKKLGFKEENKMKFKELRERLNKMSGSKLTGQEISVYYRKNPSAKKAARDPKVKKAIEFALDHGGAMTYAIKEIEKMKRGLANHPEVAKALEFANFGEDVVKEALSKLSLKEGTWHIPDTIEELRMVIALLAKPRYAKNANDVKKLIGVLPIGDDSLYDILDSYMYEPGGTQEVDKPLKKATGTFKNGVINMSHIIGDTLVQERWITGKRKGKAFNVTGHFFGYIFGDDNPENFKDLPYDLKKETDFQQAEFSSESKENIERMKKENILKRKAGKDMKRKKMVRLPI